jgi:hypothetical protein
MRAGDYFVPPLFMLPRKNMKLQLIDVASAG